MRILIVGYFKHSWHEAAWTKALTELGHEVDVYGFPHLLGENPLFRAQNRFMAGPEIHKINADLVGVVADTKPDVLLCYRALPITPETLKRIRSNFSGICVSYNNDNVFGQLRSAAYMKNYAACIKEYDLNLVYRESSVPAYMTAGSRRRFVLLPHFLPWIHKPTTLERITDVGFFGHYEPDGRLEVMEKIAVSLRGRLEIRGPGWKQSVRRRSPLREVIGSPVYGRDYAHVVSRTRLSLGLLSTINLDMYTRRFFEIPACGSVLLAPETRESRLLFDRGTEAIFFESVPELIEKVNFFLDHPEQLDEIARAGHERAVTSGYDIHARMQEWLGLL